MEISNRGAASIQGRSGERSPQEGNFKTREVCGLWECAPLEIAMESPVRLLQDVATAAFARGKQPDGGYSFFFSIIFGIRNMGYRNA